MSIKFRKPSDLWNDDPDMKLADSNKTSFTSFKFPVFPLKVKINNEIQQINIFEKAIEILNRDPKIKAVLKAQGWFDLDKAFLNSDNPTIKQWREYKAPDKSLTVAQMFPSPYLGRRCYYGFLMFENEKEWYETEEDKKDDKGNPIMKEGKPVKKNSKRDKKNPDGTPCLKLGQMGWFKEKNGGHFNFYQNTFKSTEIFVNDEAGNPIKKNGEMIYEQVEGRTFNKEIMSNLEVLEAEAVRQKVDKIYGFFLTTEIVEDKTKFIKHNALIDYFQL